MRVCRVCVCECLELDGGRMAGRGGPYRWRWQGWRGSSLRVCQCRGRELLRAGREGWRMCARVPCVFGIGEGAGGDSGQCLGVVLHNPDSGLMGAYRGLSSKSEAVCAP